MAEINALPSPAAEVDKSVAEEFEKLRGHVESGLVSGMSVALTLRDGRSRTFGAAAAENRREMIGLLFDALMDWQQHKC